uniref:Uncharacterized protein n=1 Tax=Brassica napus TaxID=3708 RepID=A0A7T7BW74_BRANA|nr:hypothetical protein [Brassica napus]QQO99779.1 hypothetical protein [Brassica napus]
MSNWWNWKKVDLYYAIVTVHLYQPTPQFPSFLLEFTTCPDGGYRFRSVFSLPFLILTSFSNLLCSAIPTWERPSLPSL